MVVERARVAAALDVALVADAIERVGGHAGLHRGAASRRAPQRRPCRPCASEPGAWPDRRRCPGPGCRSRRSRCAGCSPARASVGLTLPGRTGSPRERSSAALAVERPAASRSLWHFLYLVPLPHQHGSLGPGSLARRRGEFGGHGQTLSGWRSARHGRASRWLVAGGSWLAGHRSATTEVVVWPGSGSLNPIDSATRCAWPVNVAGKLGSCEVRVCCKQERVREIRAHALPELAARADAELPAVAVGRVGAERRERRHGLVEREPRAKIGDLGRWYSPPRCAVNAFFQSFSWLAERRVRIREGDVERLEARPERVGEVRIHAQRLRDVEAARRTQPRGQRHLCRYILIVGERAELHGHVVEARGAGERGRRGQRGREPERGHVAHGVARAGDDAEAPAAGVEVHVAFGGSRSPGRA